MIAAPTPDLRIEPYLSEHYDALVRMSRAVYEDRHEDANEWRFIHREKTCEERRYVAGSPEECIVAYAALRCEPWMVQVGRRELQLLVSPSHQRRGLGARLFRQLMTDTHFMDLRVLEAYVSEGFSTSRTFLERRGFQEQERLYTLTQNTSQVDLRPLPSLQEALAADGVYITTLAEERTRDPHCFRKFHALWLSVAADQPNYDHATNPPYDDFVRWLEHPRRLREGTFLAVRGREYIGLSMLQSRGAEPGTVVQNITGVVRPFRRRGIARTLKLRVSEYALHHEYRKIITYNDSPNEAMLRLNRQLGFERTAGRIRMERHFPSFA